MAIYFGNLDRELAERQNVIREDAERQYRGSRNTMKAITGVADTAATEIRRYQGKKRENELLKYNMERQKKDDQMKKERHTASMLDHELRNISVIEKSNVDSFRHKYYKGRDPKVLSAEHTTLTKMMDNDLMRTSSVERIGRYGFLYSKDARKALRHYHEVKKLADQGVSGSEKTLLAAQAQLDTYAPLSFNDYLVSEGLVDTSVLQHNPYRHANSLRRTTLKKYGYPISNPEELTERFSGKNNNTIKQTALQQLLEETTNDNKVQPKNNNEYKGSSKEEDDEWTWKDLLTFGARDNSKKEDGQLSLEEIKNKFKQSGWGSN